MKRVRKYISDFWLSHKKDRLAQFYEQQKYEKMSSMLSTRAAYKQLKLDDFPFLYFMIEQGNLQSIRTYFSKIDYLSHIINDDNNPMNATPISYALLQTQYQIVDLLSKNGGDLNHPNSHLQNALHLAAIFKRQASFIQGVTKYGIDVNRVDEFGNTPFHYAARTGSVEMVTTLVLSKAKKMPNHQHQYPLHMAIQSGSIQCFSLLKNDIKVGTYKEFHPLHSAARSHSEVMLNKVLDVCPLYINVQDYRGLTPLHHAVINDETNMVKKLISQRQIKLNLQDEHGNTPLHLSLFSNNLQISTELVRKGADLDIKNQDYQAPADYGMSSTDSNIKSLMLENKSRSQRVRETTQMKY